MIEIEEKKENFCRLCGSYFVKPFKEPLWKCLACSFCFIPVSKDRETEILRQYSLDQVSTAAYYKKTVEIDKKNFYQRLKTIERFICPTTLVDIGSSVGTFSELAQEFGWQSLAFEPNSVAASLAEQKGLRIINDFFSFEACQKNSLTSFDCAVLNDVLEHVVDPVSLLKDVGKILNVNGLVVITTPNIDSYFCRRYQIKPAEHLVYFSKKTLRQILENNGFEVLLCQSVSRFRHVAAAAKNPTATLSVFDKIIGFIAKINFINFFLAWGLKIFVKDEIFIIGRKK